MASRRETAQGEGPGEGPEGVTVNEVRLVGRVSGMPETRSLPSGTEVVQLRVVVRRPPDPAGRSAGRSGVTPAGKAAGKAEGSAGKAEGSAGKAAGSAAGKDIGDPASRATVDTIDVSCWTALTRRAGLRLADGDVVEVEGSLRRRFYRAGPSVQSRYDVVADRVRRASTRG